MNETRNAGVFLGRDVFWAKMGRCGGIDVMAIAVDMGLYEDLIYREKHPYTIHGK